jgi:hypothetical protein
MRVLFGLVFLLVLLAGGAWLAAGWAAPPAIEIRQPAKLLGQSGTLEVAVTAPAGSLTRLDVRLDQGANRFPLFSLPGGAEATVTQEAEDRITVTRSMGRRELPKLQSGPARLLVHAERRGPFGLRVLDQQASRDLLVRLEPPRVSVASLHHFVNHGGSEMVVYRSTPADAHSGVRVGDMEYPGFPASGAGVTQADPALKVAFFALLHDQDLATPIQLFARDDAGNQTRADFDHRVFPKPFRKSTIAIEDRFLARVVPGILEHTPDLKVDPTNLLEGFLVVNGELRRKNAEMIAALAQKTVPHILWDGPFRQLTNSQVESAFADQRTYMYRGREIDRQIHLGFDLAVTANVAVKSANRGGVLFADYLGIFGNTVIVDHGMGVQSLYAHLSSFDVKEGDRVEKDQTLGRSGMTGLAGGDHLHFTMLLNGHPVTPIDWWSEQWIEDRIVRKLREAGAPVPATGATPATASRRP